MSDGRAPTHNVIARLDDEGDSPWVEIGVGWENANGTITLKFPPTTRIDMAFLERYKVAVSPRKKR